MLIEGNDLVNLKRALASNSAVLFLGAGFSLGATNADGANLPTGRRLSEILWDYLGYSGTHDGSSLQTMFEAALKRKHEPLRFLLRQQFLVKTTPAYYSAIAQVFWYRIYTTNIDNLVETVYGKIGGPKIDTIDGSRDDFRERDALLEKIQLVKLNGANLDEPKTLTFSFRQYAQRSSEADPWYDHFVRDYSTRTTVFVGSELNEPLIWQALERRGKKFPASEGRPKSFLVRPKFSAPERENLRDYHIVPVEGTAEEFCNFLLAMAKELPSKDELIANLHPSIKDALDARIKAMGGRVERIVKRFYMVFDSVHLPERPPNVRKLYLLGAAPDWPALYNNLDAVRDHVGDLVKTIEGSIAAKAFSVISVSGYAGCGKTTTIMRASLMLAAKGYPVFFNSGDEALAAHEFAAALEFLPDNAIFVFDRANTYRSHVADSVRAARITGRGFTVIVADRSNRQIYLEAALRRDGAVAAIRVPNLTQRDIEALIDKLAENNLLGKLQGKARIDQIHEFAVRASKQILVAMREATKGDDFDHIIHDELRSIEDREARVLYLCACLVTDADFSITRDQLVACAKCPPAEALGFLDTVLRDIVIPVANVKDVLRARHRIIAEVTVGRFAAREELADAYIRILETLANDLPFPENKGNRTFKIYRAIINHNTVAKRFRESLEKARSIYESVGSKFSKDSHYWLQYGSLELTFDELEVAENYLEQARALAPDDDYVQITFANLQYRKSRKTIEPLYAKQLREEARSVLIAQIKMRPDDPYAVHILCGEELRWIQTWARRLEERKPLLSDLRDLTEQLVARFPPDEKLAELRKEVTGAYLDLAKPE